MIKVHGSSFLDNENRVVMLRGVNLGGSSKIPFRPDGSTYRSEGFFDTRNVSFVGRPFPLDEADEHYQRLKEWGFNCLRFLITWEAIEHSGPGIYDEEYLDYLYLVVKKAGKYGFYVFIDPHQDVWSRFSGGDGAPGWTLECAGFDIAHFKSTDAAIVHQTHGDPFPRMIWPTNATKLAAATMFTLFFAGNDFAPATKVDGVSIQDFLQSHYFSCIQKVVEKLKGLDCVIGYDNFNEPQRGYIGCQDLRQRCGDLDLGLSPTPWQSMLLGSAFPQKVALVSQSVFGPVINGRRWINREKESAWLPGKSCVWRENGVWDVDAAGNPVLLRPYHFQRKDGRSADFVQDYLLPFTRRFAEVVHAVDADAMIFAESEVEKPAPHYTQAPENNIVFAPHWYDGVTLLFKRYIPWLGSNLFTKTPIFGSSRIKKSYKTQLGMYKDQASQKLGNVPVLIGEIGIPFDMENKNAYRTGDFTQQARSMDRSMHALEANLLNYTIWNYTSDNTNERGDRWNDEDLSIFCRDQQKDPDDINSGGRALEAVVRPYPLQTSGTPLSIAFDYRTGSFKYIFAHDPIVTAPTVIFIPRVHYRDGIRIEATAGELVTDQSNQRLEYYPSKPGRHVLLIERK